VATTQTLSSLISFIDLRNVASRAVAERMGAKYERTAMPFGSEAGIFRHPPPG
jgi:RimJ/RimL family protein N-acetyltransferase